MLNAVIYARYSSDNQREESIDAQLRICRRHCADRNYRIIHEYIDEAFTATNDRRPDYQQMIKDALKPSRRKSVKTLDDFLNCGYYGDDYETSRHEFINVLSEDYLTGF